MLRLTGTVTQQKGVGEGSSAPPNTSKEKCFAGRRGKSMEFHGLGGGSATRTPMAGHCLPAVVALGQGKVAQGITLKKCSLVRALHPGKPPPDQRATALFHGQRAK